MIALDAVRPLNQIPKKTVKPVKMQTGGEAIQDLAEGPPEEVTTPLMPRFDQFTPEQKEQLDQEIYRKHYFDMLNEQMLREQMEQDPYFRMEEEKRRRQYFNMPELVPAGGIMDISQSTNTGLQNNGIMDIVEKLKITKPLYDI